MMMDCPSTGDVTFGADDSDDANRHTKTVTYTPENGYDHIVDLLRHPKVRARHLFPLGRERRSVPNTANVYSDAFGVTFFDDITQPWNYLPAVRKRSMTKCGLAEPIKVHVDLIPQFKANFSFLDIPTVSETDTFESIEDTLGFTTSMEWFSQVVAQMTVYCQFFPNSGHLGDCSLEGPRTGQYIAKIATPTTLPPDPEFYGDERSLVRFSSSLNTTVNEEEPIIELLARYTEINTRMYDTHPWLPELGNRFYRNGDFWNTRPLYTRGTTDDGWMQTPAFVKSIILERATATRPFK